MAETTQIVIGQRPNSLFIGGIYKSVATGAVVICVGIWNTTLGGSIYEAEMYNPVIDRIQVIQADKIEDWLRGQKLMLHSPAVEKV